MLPTITLFTKSISTYYLVMLLGYCAMGALMHRRRERYGLSAWQAASFTTALMVSGVLGCKVLYVLQNLAEVRTHGLTAGGFSFFGAVFLIPPLMAAFGLALGLRPARSLDAAAPCVALMIAMMRVGCFLNGCCGGWVTGWGFRWPTQAMESVGDFAILSWLLTVEDRGGRGLYPRFLVSYGAMRFCIEFLRDTEKAYLRLSDGQWCALAAVLIGAWALQRGRRRIRAAK